MFSDQIEKKQRELQPWDAKINQKKAHVDVRVNERDMLVQKAVAAKEASEEAERSLKALQDEQVSKVRRSPILHARIGFAHD